MFARLLALALPLLGLATSQAAIAAPNQPLSPSLLGARGDGQSPGQDQAGFAALMQVLAQSQSSAPTGRFDYAQYQNGVMIEPGIYDAGGLRLVAAKAGAQAVRLVARIPGTVIIRVPKDQYFLTVDGPVNQVFVDGLTFVGGKGAFRFTHPGNNVTLMHSFTRNSFLNYTECAISNNADDHPYLRVRDNVFMGSPDAPTIGVAWGGYVDLGTIEDNAFLRNAYHVKIGPRLSSTMLVRHNDFISWGGKANLTQADVWIAANVTQPYGVNSGHGITISENKFGNENQNPNAPRILIAPEADTSGLDRATRLPSSEDKGFVTQLVVAGNVFAGGGRITASVLESRISELRNLEWRSNKMVGSPYATLIGWINPRRGTYTNTNASVEITPADIAAGSVPAQSFSNATFGQLRDYGGYFPGNPNAIDLWPASDDPALSVLATASGANGRKANGKATLQATMAPGMAGPLALANLGMASGGDSITMSFGRPTMADGGMVFIDLALMRSRGSALSRAQIMVRNASDGTVALRRSLPLPDRLGALRLPVYLPPSSTPAGWQAVLIGESTAGAGANDVILGDWIINSGPSRIGRDRALGSNKAR